MTTRAHGKVVLLSATRTSPQRGTGSNSTSDAQLVVSDSNFAMNVDSSESTMEATFSLDEFCIPNIFSEVSSTIVLDEQGVGIFLINLSGYFTYSAFATYLQAQLNAAGTLVYTVTFSPYPFAAYTISATGNFRLNLSRPSPDTFFLSDVSVHLGLTPQDYAASTTPYAASITSTKAAIISVNTQMLIMVQPLPCNSVMSTGLNFCYIVPVDADKTEYIRFKPQNQFKQKICFPANGTENWSSWRVQISRVDGSKFNGLADWSMTLGYSFKLV